jgi:hypothetical protein
MTTRFIRTKGPVERAREIAAQRKVEDEQRQTEAAVTELETNMRRLRRESAVESAAFWAQPLEQVIQPNVPQSAVAVDLSVALPTREGEPDGPAAHRAYDDFITNLTARSGFTLSAGAGAKRLVAFVNVHTINCDADMGNPETWRRAFDRLIPAFEANGELGYDPSLKTIADPEPPPVPEPTYSDLLKLPAETIEDRRRLKQAADKEYGLGVCRPIAEEWIAHLADKHGIVLNDFDVVYKMFRDNQWSFHDRRNYDKARVQLIKQGYPGFTTAALTDAEKLSIELENVDVSRLSFVAKQELKRRLRSVTS